MKNKGFTLVEMLAAVVILGILFTIVAVNFTGIFTNTQEKVFKSYKDSMKTAAIQYMIDTGDVPTRLKYVEIDLSYLLGQTKRLNPSTGKTEKANPPYLDYFENPSGDDKCINGSKVLIQLDDYNRDTTDDEGRTDNNKKYKYYTCLNCNNYKDMDCQTIIQLKNEH